MIDAAPRAARAAAGDSLASEAVASPPSALRDGTADASAVPHACCGLSVVELVIAPRLMRRSLACSGRRSLRRSIDMGLLARRKDPVTRRRRGKRPPARGTDATRFWFLQRRPRPCLRRDRG